MRREIQNSGKVQKGKKSNRKTQGNADQSGWDTKARKNIKQNGRGVKKMT